MSFAAGINFHIYQQNENVPIVLLHGAGGSYLSWPPQVRRLTGYRVYALDLPGHGNSSPPGCNTIQEYTQRVLEWLDAVDISQAVMIGHSMGGAIAQWLAIDQPGRVSALVLISSGARLPVNPKLIQESSDPASYQRIVKRVVSWSFTPRTPANLTGLIARRMANTSLGVLQEDFLACDQFDLSERVHQIHCPTLVMCGAEDRMTPLQYSQFLADNIPGARLETVPEAGHMVMIEKPQEILLALGGFLARLPYVNAK